MQSFVDPMFEAYPQPHPSFPLCMISELVRILSQKANVRYNLERDVNTSTSRDIFP